MRPSHHGPFPPPHGCLAVTDLSPVQMPWSQVLVNKPFWAILVAHAGWGFGHTICYAWLPNFYYTTYGISVRDSAWLSALPWVATVIVTNAGGFLADSVVRNKTMGRKSSRKLLQALGSFGPAVCLIYLAAAVNGNVPELSLPSAVSFITVALALGGLTCSGFASNHQDLTTRYVQPSHRFEMTDVWHHHTGAMAHWSCTDVGGSPLLLSRHTCSALYCTVRLSIAGTAPVSCKLCSRALIHPLMRQVPRASPATEHHPCTIAATASSLSSSSTALTSIHALQVHGHLVWYHQRLQQLCGNLFHVHHGPHPGRNRVLGSSVRDDSSRVHSLCGSVPRMGLR